MTESPIYPSNPGEVTVEFLEHLVRMAGGVVHLARRLGIPRVTLNFYLMRKRELQGPTRAALYWYYQATK